jgi:hypothetical protein
MKLITKLFLFVIVLLALTGYETVESSSVFLHDPTWEAPGGYSMSSTGNVIQPGGITWTYTNFDTSAYDQLYYVIGDYIDTTDWEFTPEGPILGTKYGGTSRLVYDASASNLGGGKVVWTNPSPMSIAVITGSGPGWVNVDARFTLSVFDLGDQPLALVDASTINGMDSRVGGAHQVTGDFKANWLFEFAYQGNSSSWLPAGQFYYYLNTSSNDEIISSVTRAFYYQPVPVPTAVWLLASGLICLVGLRRKIEK